MGTRWRRYAHFAGRLSLTLGVCSCELLAPLDEISDASPSEPPCRALEAAKVKSVVSGSGPDWTVVLVRHTGTVESTYMDKTEVTVAEYRPWADDNAASFTSWHSWCQWKSPFPSNPAKSNGAECSPSIPANQTDPFASDKPIRCVDWCDAEAFCRTARGGRLCFRSTGGGSSLPENRPDEWPSACNNAGTTVWPWGDAAKANVCNLGQQAGCGSFGFSCGPVPVRSFEGCRNAGGIFDLIGNVTEWLGNCAALKIDTAEGGCLTMGGNYDDAIENLACTSALSSFSKSGRSPQIGFRCCYDLTPAERQACGLP